MVEKQQFKKQKIISPREIIMKILSLIIWMNLNKGSIN